MEMLALFRLRVQTSTSRPPYLPPQFLPRLRTKVSAKNTFGEYPSPVVPPLLLFCNSKSLKTGMSFRRSNSTKENNIKSPCANGNGSNRGIDHKREPKQAHSFKLFSSHSHDEEEHIHGAEKILAAFRGPGDPGSQITLVGLFANIILTAAKGTAGWFMHSASLFADACHSLSDLLGDFVTLLCWRLSRKPPSERYPYGFAKFETLGTTTISLLLIGGALGIGFHSYNLLIRTLSETASTLPTGLLQNVLQNVTSVAPSVPVIGHTHVHAVDPNAAWFAAVSILVKEWLYRITKNVADAEKSPVLLANAIHHRSDAYSSTVALFAILGTSLFPVIPLDSIGGLIVSFVILRQGTDLFKGAWGDLTDAGVSEKKRQALRRILEPLISSSSPSQSHPGDQIPGLLGIRHLCARRAGSLVFVDLTVDVPGALDMHQASSLEHRITQTLKTARKEISDVRVKFHPVDVRHLEK